MKTAKRTLALLLAAAMITLCLPIGGYAAGSAPTFTYSESALRQSIAKTETYIGNIIPSASSIASTTSTWKSQFTWDNEKRESAGKSYLFEWSYYNGVVFEGLDYIYDATGNADYYNNVSAYLGAMINGNTSTWKNCTNNSGKQAAGYVNYHGVDCYKTASLLLDYGYTNMAATLYQDLKNAERNYNDSAKGYNFRHTWQSAPSYYVWLDGLYMVQPFMAEYASYIGDTAELNKIAGRFQWIGNNMYNNSKGLYYHAANSASDHAAGYWLRAVGWYAAAMADVIPYMTGSQQTAMIAQLKKLTDGMLPYQDANTGMWHNYIDQTSNSGASRLETSGTALMAYAMMKAVNNGWLADSYAAPAAAAFNGICNNKLNATSLSDICVKGSPGATGTNSTFAANEGKGLGPFLMAYAEMLTYLDRSAVPTVTGISLNTDSVKTIYHVGESFTAAGLTVTAEYSDGTFEDVTDDVAITAPSTQNAGSANVSVVWGEFSASYPITVSAHSAGNAVTENYRTATCTENGSYDQAYYCTVCGIELRRDTVTLPASGHSYSSRITRPANCETDGIKTYTCLSCAHTYTETIPAAGHHYDSGAVTAAPTCTEDGVRTYTCANCTHTYTEAVPATGHHYDSGAVTLAADCITDGVKTFTCANCGGTYTEVIPAAGHTAGVPVTENYRAATCEAAGSYDTAVYCTVCGAELSRETTVIPMGEHTYASEVTLQPTCTESGVRTYTCADCGGSYTEIIPATGHTAGQPVTENTVAATCTDAGSYELAVYCLICGEELSRVTNTVPATGHASGTEYTENYVPATCTENGSFDTVTVCAACGEILSRRTTVISAVGHSYTSAITADATCTEPGTRTFTCTVCCDSYTEAIPAAGHIAGAAVTEAYTAPTCTACGSYEEAVYCTVCGAELSRTTFTIAEIGHDYRCDTVPATCTEDGTVTYTCAACADSYTVSIPATGHTAGSAVIENVTDATCVDAGSYDTVTYCTVCGEELSRVTAATEPLGHNYRVTSVLEAGCTEDGVRTFTCTVCGDTYQTAIPATGHSAGTPVTEHYTAAGCTAAGHYDSVTYCTHCGEELSRSTAAIPATGHTAGTPVTENYTAATCTTAGHYDTVTYCTHCHAVLSRSTTNIPAAGHNWDNGVITTQPTPYNTGIKTFTCRTCGATYTEVLPAEGVAFVQDTNGIDSGCEYVIRAGTSGSNTYALGVVNGTLQKVAVTVSNGKVINPPDSVIWYANRSGNGYQLQNKSNWMFLTVNVQTSYSGWSWWGWGGTTTTVSLTLSWNPTVWNISRSGSSYKFKATANNTNYYLRYSNNNFELSTSSGSLYTYKRQN